MDYRLRTIRDRRLRALIDSDSRELEVAVREHLYKSALVLAGGIVEALLTNYLQVVGYRHPPKGTDPNKMRFEDLIAASKLQGGLSSEAAAVCAALKGYRNLVHPGRVMRENVMPDRDRAVLAANAVELVLKDVHTRLRNRPEWAAERVLDDAEDPLVTGAEIRRRVRSLCDLDRRRLLVEVVPQRVAEARPVDDEDAFLIGRACHVCFWEAWKGASEQWRREAAAEVVRLAAEGPNGDMVADNLYSVGLLEYLSPDDRPLVIDYLIALADHQTKSGQGRLVDLSGCGRYVDDEQVKRFVTVLAQAALSKSHLIAAAAAKTLVEEAQTIPDAYRRVVTETIDDLVETCRREGRTNAAAKLSDVRFAIEPLTDDEIPR
jgi:hypothetical protein